MTQTMLSRLGCKAVTASNGFDAVETFNERKDEIRLVVLDLTMPGKDGWHVLAELRAIQPDIPVILVSGHDEAQVMQGDHAEFTHAFLHEP